MLRQERQWTPLATRCLLRREVGRRWDSGSQRGPGRAAPTHTPSQGDEAVLRHTERPGSPLHSAPILISCAVQIFMGHAITAVPFFLPFTSLRPVPPPTRIPPLSSCPWVVHVSSLASPLPILFLTSPCLFCTYQLCFSLPVPFPLFSSSPPHW